jgi:Tfp pilus assembly protein PilZ
MKEKMDLLLEQLKIKIKEKMNQSLGQLTIFQRLENAQKLQDSWNSSKKFIDLELYAKEIDTLLSGSPEKNPFSELKKISNVFKQTLSSITKSCDKMCSHIGSIIKELSDDNEIEYSIDNDITSDLLLKSKINRLSISHKIDFLKPQNSSQVNHIMDLLVKMTKSENNTKMINNLRQSIFSNGQMFQEDKPSCASSPERKKDWNFGLGSRNTLGKISLPGTVYWEGDRKSLMGSWNKEKDLTDRMSGRELVATER